MFLGVKTSSIIFSKNSLKRFTGLVTSPLRLSPSFGAPAFTATRAFSILPGGNSSDKSPARSFLTKNGTYTVNVHPPTNKEAISADLGLSNFIKRTYLYTGTSIAGSLGIATVISSQYPSLSIFAILGSFFTGLIGITGISISSFKIKEDVYSSHLHPPVKVYSSENSFFRLASFGTVVGSMGVLMVPVFQIYPDAITPALLASSTVFSTSILYAYSRPVGSLSSWEPALHTGLISLILVGFGGVVSNIFLGHGHALSVALNNIDLYFGIPLFAGFVAYDTHKAVEMYQERQPDHLTCALELYLDFINILVRFIEIIGKAQKNR